MYFISPSVGIWLCIWLIVALEISVGDCIDKLDLKDVCLRRGGQIRKSLFYGEQGGFTLHLSLTNEDLEAQPYRSCVLEFDVEPLYSGVAFIIHEMALRTRVSSKSPRALECYDYFKTSPDFIIFPDPIIESITKADEVCGTVLSPLGASAVDLPSGARIVPKTVAGTRANFRFHFGGTKVRGDVNLTLSVFAYSKERNCRMHEIPCGNGICIPAPFRCSEDGAVECGFLGGQTGLDEEGCNISPKRTRSVNPIRMSLIACGIVVFALIIPLCLIGTRRRRDATIANLRHVYRRQFPSQNARGGTSLPETHPFDPAGTENFRRSSYDQEPPPPYDALFPPEPSRETLSGSPSSPATNVKDSLPHISAEDPSQVASGRESPKAIATTTV